MMRRIVAIFIVLACCTGIFGGCALVDPPTVQDVDKIFQENYDDFMIINNFVASSQYRDIRIDDCSGKMRVNSEEIRIDNDLVNAALKRLMMRNILKSADRSGHTIKYQFWTRFNDAGCGLAFSNADGFKPTIMYLTELIPLQNKGWYYYGATRS